MHCQGCLPQFISSYQYALHSAEADVSFCTSNSAGLLCSKHGNSLLIAFVDCIIITKIVGHLQDLHASQLSYLATTPPRPLPAPSTVHPTASSAVLTAATRSAWRVHIAPTLPGPPRTAQSKTVTTRHVWKAVPATLNQMPQRPGQLRLRAPTSRSPLQTMTRLCRHLAMVNLARGRPRPGRSWEGRIWVFLQMRKF